MQLPWIALGIVALFVAVMLLGVRARRSEMSRNLRIRAADAWAPFADRGYPPDALLFGVRQDSSTTETGMLVRDSNDEEVGRITFHAAARTGAITISTARDSFTVDVLPTWSRRMVLHRANDVSDVLCTFGQSTWGAHRFDVAGVGAIESRRLHRLRLAPTSEISLNGVAAGASRHLGGAVDRGVALMLPTSIPLPVRMFVLALQ